MMDTRFQLTLSVLLAVIREDNGQKLTVSLLPKFPDVFVGDDITLICKGGAGMIKWLIDGEQQSHQDSLMLLTAVTSNNSGEYECEQGGTKSDKLNLTVLELEPHAQLSPSIGGAVMSKGDGRNLVLQVDDDLNGWKCYVLRGENGFRIIPAVDEKKAVIFAELREAKRATFWCKKGTQRSNAVTLKMTVSADAARQEGDSDVQELKVIGGPPTATVDLASTTSLRCSCNACPAVCTSYRWYHTHIDDSSARQSLSESGQHIDMKEDGLYSCRMDCGKGFSRFSNVYHYKGQPTTESVSVLPIMVAPILIVLGVLIVVLVALKCRRRGESSVQTTKQDKDKKTGGDNEQIQLTDQAVYHTLGESTDKDKGEGGYEALQKRQEEMEYHTLGPGEGQSQGEGQGGYEALKNVKAEVYQTLSSAESKTPAAKAEGGYEQLPQKAKDYEAVTVEVNPYKALKAGQQDKKQATSKNKE